MGVNHLRRDAAIATSRAAQGKTNVEQSHQISAGPNFKRPAETSGTRQVPQVGPVNAFESRAVHTGTHPAQPPKGNMNGARAGAKSGQEKTGTQKGNNHPVSGAALY